MDKFTEFVEASMQPGWGEEFRMDEYRKHVFHLRDEPITEHLQLRIRAAYYRAEHHYPRDFRLGKRF